MVFVLDKRKQPLMPCAEKRARKLLAAGRARVHRPHPFTIRLIDRVLEDSVVEPVRVKLDPGANTTGVAIVREEQERVERKALSTEKEQEKGLRRSSSSLNTQCSVLSTSFVLHLAEIEHRGEAVRKHIKQRSNYRRRSRSANLRYRAPRFNNRRRDEGWLPPGLRCRLDNVLAWVGRYRKLCPIGAVSVETARFDTQAMQNPDIAGVEYQQGELAGYELREYMTLACRPCNERKGSHDVRELLKRDSKRLAHVLATAKAPLATAAAVNVTRRVLWQALASTGLDLEVGSGGRTRWNRTRFGIPKAHALDAICVGAVERVVGWQQPVLAIKACSRGSYQRTRVDNFGFPRGYLTRQKRVHGFATGDLVQAIVLQGKKPGTYVGRVAVRASGSFNIQTAVGTVQGISYKYCRLLQRADGYTYNQRKRHFPRPQGRGFRAENRMSPALASVAHLAPEQVIGMPFAELFEPEARDAARRLCESVRGGCGSGTEELRLRAAGGGSAWVLASLALELGEEGGAGLRGTITDTTELRQLQSRLSQADKMRALGELAGGIAHDFNNLLAAITANAELLEMRADSSAPHLLPGVRAIMDTSRVAARMVERLLGFARKGSSASIPFDLHAAIRHAIEIFHAGCTSGIRIEARLLAQSTVLRGDPAQVTNALLNLAFNARDAMPGGGTLTFETKDVDTSALERCRVPAEPGSADRMVGVWVSDTGSGISADIRERVFEPFFTTKPRGSGTGLGLATVYGCVKRHGWTVELSSEVGEGTTVTLCFPAESPAAIGGAAESPAAGLGAAPPAAARRRIIVVDDEEGVRGVMRIALEDAGYEVVDIASAASALAFLETQRRDGDAIIADIYMPGMGGKHLVQEMRRRGWRQAVILVTGMALDNGVPESEAVGANGFLAKPFSVRALLGEVARVLGSA